VELLFADNLEVQSKHQKARRCACYTHDVSVLFMMNAAAPSGCGQHNMFSMPVLSAAPNLFCGVCQGM
jgi:hypothetical protein